MNPDIQVVETKILSDNWYILKKVSFLQKGKKGVWTRQTREVYDRGNGATILLYHLENKTLILTRQFRMPTYMNGNTHGELIETCAGLLDGEDPQDAIKRETEEETGYVISKPHKIFELYMSPGSVTELVYFYMATYEQKDRLSEGGGVEGEEIEVLEMGFQDAFEMVSDGRIKDGKTVILLQYLRQLLTEGGNHNFP